MADAAAVILSTIEKLDSWLLQKPDRRNDHARLCSLRSEKKDLLVGMAEVWENDKEMLYTLLVRVVNLGEVWTKVDNDRLYYFLHGMEYLWELNCSEKLHCLAVEMMDPYMDMHRKKLYSLAVETADLWKDSKGKLNKEKLYTWLPKITDLWEQDELFRSLEDMISLAKPIEEDMTFFQQRKKKVELLDEEDWKYVEGVRNNLRLILNKLEDEGSCSHGHLHYFMSDVLEMAHDVQLLFHVIDSDPFILFFQIFSRYVGSAYVNNVMNCVGSFLRFFAEIKPIHECLEETAKRVRKFGEINNVREEMVGPSPTYSESESHHHVVGLEEDVKLLLCNAETTTGIYGPPGIGKTTLAREFYNHPEIVDGFQCRAWVCLFSWKLSRKKLLIELIRQFIYSSERDDMVIEKMENKALQQMLHQHLQDKPYLIVLDDVSEVTDLQYVYRMLPDDKRSRLLFTTRNQEICCKPCGFDCEHQMKNLDGDKSWQLLLQTTFLGSGDHEGFPKQLEKKGRDMLIRKSGGLPLAIKEVGRQWAEKRGSGSEWKQVVESTMDLELSETSMAFESIYLDMDQYEKPYFLRLAFFKEGTITTKYKLHHIWTAGGLEEQFRLNRLIRPSIIEEIDMNFRKYKRIRINVHYHRLSITKAVDEIGLEILMRDGCNRASHEPRYHRVIYCSRDDKFNHNYSSTNQDEHLVSLFLYGGGYSSISHPSYWKHFEKLKILDMEGFGLKMLSETVGDLTELRYLGLRNNYIQELPQSLRRLKMIEVLDIAQNFMVEMPDILWEMDHLRHLYMSDIICQKPLKIQALKNLKTLTYISVDSWTNEVSGLIMMRHTLRKLGIEEVDGNSNMSKLFASLVDLSNLNYLILRGFHFRNMPSLDELVLLQNLHYLKLEGRLTRLPNATNFPPNISYLSLVNSCLDEDPIPILEKLPQLSDLNLQNAYTGHDMVISNEGFHYLSNLVIRELWNLRNFVKVGEGGMRFFHRSEINSCPYLVTVPQEILSRLDHLRSQSLKCATP